MYQITKKEDTKDTSLDRFYGIQLVDFKNTKHFVYQESEDDSKFSFRVIEGFTKSKTSPYIAIPGSLQEVLSFALESGYEIYEFDDISSLVEWLLKK